MTTDLQEKTALLPDIHRKLPHNEDAEQGVIASFLLSPVAVADICIEMGVRPGWFHEPAMGELFSECMKMVEDNIPLDFVTLTERMRNKRRLDQVGGAFNITRLYSYLPTAANVRYYLDHVQEAHTLRRIIMTGTDAASRAYDMAQHGTAAAQLEAMESAVLAIRKDDGNEMRESNPKEAVMAAVTAIQDLYERRGEISGLSTGLADLDRTLNGLHGSELIVFAARPSMGKTALAMNIAEHVAVDLRKPVLVFSAEMSTGQLYQRMLCSRARVSISRLRDGFLAERDFPALGAAASKLDEAPLFIVETTSPTIAAVRAKARRMHKKLIAEGNPEGLACVVIDYLQLLRSSSKRASENRQLEISEISAGLKALAKELDRPVIVLAQLNRNPEQRAGKAKGRPMLSDLRESGSIEQDADVVGLLVRDEYYATNDEEKEGAKGKATLIIAKQRKGPVGDVHLTFDKEFTRFSDRDADATEGSWAEDAAV